MTTENITDAELLGRYAREAIELGRFRMAGALTGLAQRAADFEARVARIERDERMRVVPVIGATRDEQPQWRAGVDGPSGDGQADLAAVARDNRPTPVDEFHMLGDGRLASVTDTVVSSSGSHAPNACAAQLPTGECGALIGWSDGFSSAYRKGWYHLDQSIDGHGAVPTLQAVNALDARRPDVTRTDLRVADWVNGAE